MKIECIDVSYTYGVPATEWALRDITFSMAEGERIAVIGPSGSGKTTLIQLLDALILPTKGDILFDGVSVRKLAKARKLASIRRRIGLLFQFPEQQFFHETAYEELTFSLRNFFDLPEGEIEERAGKIMSSFQMDLERLKAVSPFVLSSGEKRKLALASALIEAPEVLILDEPTAGMDAAGRNELMRIVDALDRTAVLIVTHNLEDFLPIVRRCIGISGSRIVADAGREELVDRCAELTSAGIVPPLVLQVRSVLKREGVQDHEGVYRMEELIEKLRESCPKQCSHALKPRGFAY